MWARIRSFFGKNFSSTNAGWTTSSISGFTRPRKDREWAVTYGNNARLQAPVHAIAEDTAASEWSLNRVVGVGTDGKLELEPIFEHELLTLLRNPTPLMTFSQWLKLIQIYLDTVGKAPLRLFFNESQAKPDEIWPIPPHWLFQLPNQPASLKDEDGNEFISGEFFRVNWFGRPRKLDVREVIYLYNPDPLHPYLDGLGQARSLDDEVNIDEAMAKFNNYYFRNSAFLGALVSIPGAGDQLEAMEEKWRTEKSGILNTRRSLFVDADGPVSVNNLSPTPEELSFVEGRKLHRDLCAQGFQVPPERLGIIESSNRATIQAADFQQQSKNVKPRLKYLAEAFNRWLVPFFEKSGERLLLLPEDPVKETKEVRLDVAERGATAGILTINEARKLIDHPPIPNGDVLMIPVNNVALVPIEGEFEVPTDEEA